MYAIFHQRSLLTWVQLSLQKSGQSPWSQIRDFWRSLTADRPLFRALAIVIIPHNLTTKFQPLDLSVNKAAQTYISEKYSTWIANKFSKQLKKGTTPPKVKVFLHLLVIRPFHAKWIVDLYHHLKADKEMIVNRFRAAKISETIKNAQDITYKVEYRFRDMLTWSGVINSLLTG